MAKICAFKSVMLDVILVTSFASREVAPEKSASTAGEIRSTVGEPESSRPSSLEVRVLDS